MNTSYYSFTAGGEGDWLIRDVRAIIGESLASAESLKIVNGDSEKSGIWTLHGVTSYERYVTRTEKQELVATQEGLGRVTSTFSALIPIKKSDVWWAMSQDERRRIFEEQSKHINKGMQYLPNIARRLHHCRDLGSNEPFDFLTWFEYSPEDEEMFDDLLGELRSTLEWEFVEREVDVRLIRKQLELD